MSLKNSAEIAREERPATSRASRPKVHALYERLGFASYGLEFRLNLGAAD
jgi:hypothetical protein